MDEQVIKAIEIDCTCPHCFNQTKKTFEWLTENKSIVCACGADYPLNRQFIRDTFEQLKEVSAGDIVIPFRG